MTALVSAGAAVAGRSLAAATSALAAVRRARKPLHPRGEVQAGRLVRTGSAERTGVPWLDDPGEDEVLVRRSRAIGLPRALPDILGLAVRVPATDGVGDVLFATTGRGRVTRFTLTFSRRGRPMTTLLPYRAGTGALLLGAVATGADDYLLSWARPRGAWHDFATLHLAVGAADAEVSFDPLVNQVQGLDQYPVVERLREPAYLRARRSRRSTG